MRVFDSLRGHALVMAQVSTLVVHNGIMQVRILSRAHLVSPGSLNPVSKVKDQDEYNEYMSSNGYYSIAEILQDHEWEFLPGKFPVGWCRGQVSTCKWRGTQFEWAFHVEELIKQWLVDDAESTNNMPPGFRLRLKNAVNTLTYKGR